MTVRTTALHRDLTIKDPDSVDIGVLSANRIAEYVAVCFHEPDAWSRPMAHCSFLVEAGFGHRHDVPAQAQDCKSCLRK